MNIITLGLENVIKMIFIAIKMMMFNCLMTGKVSAYIVLKFLSVKTSTLRVNKEE